MNNAPAKINNPTTLQVINEDMFSDTRIEMIRNSVAKGAPPDVFMAMIDIAKRRGLDPLAKQIICARFGSTWQMIVTIDGYRSIAEQTGQYAGSDAPIFTWDEEILTSLKKRAPTSATVTVYKLIGGIRAPFSATVYWEEYAGSNNWNSMPRTMLAKVAESHALRKAFPSVLSGTYTQEEMDQAKRTGEKIDTATGEVREYTYDPETDTGVPPHAAASRGAVSTQEPRSATKPTVQVSVDPTDEQEALIDAWSALDEALKNAMPDRDDEERAEIATAAFAKAGIRDIKFVPLNRVAKLTEKLENEQEATVEWLTTTYAEWAELNHID